MKYQFSQTFKNLPWISLGLLAISMPANAFQFTIDSVNSTFVTGGSSGTANGITFNGQQQRVDSFVANGSTYTTVSPATLTFRRGNFGTGNNLIFQEQLTGSTDLRGPIPTSTENALNGNNLFVGSDNLFVNTGEPNISNIERADYRFGTSTTVDVTRGFAVFERGNNGGHDGFQVALVLGEDGSGNPTSFSDLLTINAGSYGNTNLNPNASPTRTILRDTNGDEVFFDTGSTGQEIGGVVITLDSFTSGGSAITGPVFGYSLFGSDVNPANGSLANVTSAAFVNSVGGNSGNGLDPVAVNVGLVEVPFEFSPGLGLLLSGGGLLAFNFSKKRKIKKLEL